jgi:hypothetical protein
MSKKDGLEESIPYIDEADPVNQELTRAALIRLIGAKLEKEDPPCGLRQVIAALGLSGNEPEEEEQTPQGEEDHGEVVGKRRYFTAEESAKVMAKDKPDEELSEEIGWSVTSIVQHRNHVKNRPVGMRPRHFGKGYDKKLPPRKS